MAAIHRTLQTTSYEQKNNLWFLSNDRQLYSPQDVPDQSGNRQKNAAHHHKQPF